MNRNSAIGYALIFVLFAAYVWLTVDNTEKIEENKKVVDSTATADSLAIASEVENDTVPLSIVDSTQTDSSISEKSVIAEEKTYQLENEELKITFSNYGGTVKSVELKNYKRSDSSALVLLEENRMRMAYELNLRTELLRTEVTPFDAAPIATLEDGTQTLTFTYQINDKSSLKQVYTLSPDGFNLSYDLLLENLYSEFSSRDKSFVLLWEAGLELQEHDLEDERNVSTVFYKFKGEEGVEELSSTSSDEEELTGEVQWISFKQKFFNSTLITENAASLNDVDVSVVVPDNETGSHIKDMKASALFTLSGQPIDRFGMKFYFGPNHYQTLKKQEIGLEEVIPLGPWVINWINRFAVIPIFNWLNNFFGSYGMIILLLTLIIKLVLFPLTYKSYVSMAKMRVLKPELEALKEKAGDNMQKLQQEQLKLYKKAGVNPLGGCLPMLIQMPILFAMFRFFPSSIELRQESFLWATDLSTYDSILDLPFNIPFYGSHVSLFTLLMTVSTLLYTMMNNQMTGANSQMKWIGYLMPIMFLGFFNNYAAALSYYYFLANMITFTQNWAIRKFIIDEDKIHQKIQENKKKPVKMKKSGLAKRLEDMAKKRGVDPYTGKRK